MKNVLFLLCLIPTALIGQSEGRNLLAHYPLTEHFGDITGQEDTLTTANVIIDEEGLFIDGADIRSDTANKAQVTVEALDLDDFYITLEVNIDSIVDDGVQPISSRNIITGGLSWRWMRAIASQQFNFISLWHSDGAANETTPLVQNEWIEIGLWYQAEFDMARLYLNGDLAIQDSFELVGGNDKTIGLSDISANMWPMKGHWRNLKVYGPDVRLSPLALDCQVNQLPGDNGAMDGSVEIAIGGGWAPYRLSWNGGDTTFANTGTFIIPNLRVGSYNFELLDSFNVRQTCETALQLGLLPLIANYPMQGDLKDILNLNPDLEIAHIDVRDSALYIDGSELSSDTINHIGTNIAKLNHDDFEIQLDFYLDSITTPDVQTVRTILMAGSSFRWAVINYHNETKELSFRFNNAITRPNLTTIEYNRWYKVIISYNWKIRTLTLSLDGIVIDEIVTDLVTGIDKFIVLACCNRSPMRGFWRNLKIYSAEEVITPELTLRMQTLEWNGSTTSSDGEVRVQIDGGSRPFNARLLVDDIPIDSQLVYGREAVFQELAVGTYEVQISDFRGNSQHQSFEVLPPQTNLPIMSFWPMDLSLMDTASVHRSLTLTNVEHEFFEGLALPGNNNSEVNDVDQIFTTLATMNQNDFYISLNVTIDSIDNPSPDFRSIFVLGSSTRWMYPYYSASEQQIYLAYNNQFHPEAGGFPFEYGREYELAISYNKETGVGKLFMDRQEVIRDTFDLETGGDVSFAMNCNCGPGPMKGNWRKLRVYSASLDTTTTSNKNIELEGGLKIFPNPGSSSITIELGDHKQKVNNIYWYDGLGQKIKQLKFYDSKNLQVDISNLLDGVYWIQVGKQLEKFIKL